MKKQVYFLLTALLFISFSNINAQPSHKHGRGYHPGMGPYGYPDSCHIQLMVDDMREALDLSDKQVAQIEEIHYAHIEKVKALEDQYNNDCVGEREARRGLRDDMISEMKAVLSDEQKMKLDEFMSHRGGPHRHHPKGS